LDLRLLYIDDFLMDSARTSAVLHKYLLCLLKTVTEFCVCIKKWAKACFAVFPCFCVCFSFDIVLERMNISPHCEHLHCITYQDYCLSNVQKSEVEIQAFFPQIMIVKFKGTGKFLGGTF